MTPPMMPAIRPAIVLFAHGARDPEWAEPFRKLRDMVEAKAPGLVVELAFLELMQPSLPDAIAALARSGINAITLVPVFLAQGGHLKEDLPKLLAEIRRVNNDVTIEVTPAIGEVEALLAAIADWACEAAGRKRGEAENLLRSSSSIRGSAAMTVADTMPR